MANYEVHMMGSIPHTYTPKNDTVKEEVETPKSSIIIEDQTTSPECEAWEKEVKRIRSEIVNQYLTIISPYYNKMISLRNMELSKIVNTEEYINFRNSLSVDEKITIDGYLIHRKKTTTTDFGLPGFSDTVSSEYEYGQAPEDMTFIFGTKEYTDKMRELAKKIMTFKDFLKTYYATPYSYKAFEELNIPVLPLTGDNIIKAYSMGNGEGVSSENFESIL